PARDDRQLGELMRVQRQRRLVRHRQHGHRQLRHMKKFGDPQTLHRAAQTPRPARARQRANPPAPPLAILRRSNVTGGLMFTDLAQLVTDIARRARVASLALATIPSERKNAALLRLAELLPASSAEILAANAKDLAEARANGLATHQI